MKYSTAILATLALSVTATAGCSMMLAGDEPLSLTVKNGVFVARGTIDTDAPEIVQAALDANPNIKTIVMEFLPGSIDDEANLVASRIIHEAGMTTIVPQGGFVASGGTDMFLAGTTRQVGQGACIGVHSWAEVGLFGQQDGQNVPKDDPVHQDYIDFYNAIHIDPAFYWFTLDAADADNMHYVSKAEMAAFEMVTGALPTGKDATTASCDATFDSLAGY